MHATLDVVLAQMRGVDGGEWSAPLPSELERAQRYMVAGTK
jgi:hypothetical protein